MSLIDLTNYSEHPVEPGWLVFRYPTPEHARDMADELQRAGIKWEADLVDGPPFMVGVRKINRSAAEKLNYIVLGRYRKPFISSRLLRWVVIIVTVGILALAFAGMLLSGS